MRNPKICKIYAKIFFEKAKADKALPNVLEDFKFLSDIFNSDKRVEKFFTAKICSFNEKVNILKKHKLHKLSMSFLEAMIKYNQMDYLSDVYEELLTMKVASEGMIRAMLFSANAMSQKDIEVCQTHLEKELKKKFFVEHKVDTSLIGGVILQFGSMMYDASVRNSIQKLNMM